MMVTDSRAEKARSHLATETYDDHFCRIPDRRIYPRREPTASTHDTDSGLLTRSQIYFKLEVFGAWNDNALTQTVGIIEPTTE